MFLIHTPPDKENAIARSLEVGFRANGFTTNADPRPRRVVSGGCLAHTLSTFQLLGGFGLLLGCVGACGCDFRGVRERLGELALLSARSVTARGALYLVLIENIAPASTRLASGVLARHFGRRTLRVGRRCRGAARGAAWVGAGSRVRCGIRRYSGYPACAGHSRTPSRVTSMIKLGLLDFDTSHCVEFTMLPEPNR